MNVRSFPGPYRLLMIAALWADDGNAESAIPN